MNTHIKIHMNTSTQIYTDIEFAHLLKSQQHKYITR